MIIPASPRALGLPYDDWRPGQRLMIRTALNASTPHVVLQAPTGSGKSIVAAALTRLDRRRRIILTATNALGDQYCTMFPFLQAIRGMANYECYAARDEHRDYFPLRDLDRRPVMCDDGMCREGIACTLKQSGCSYFDALRDTMGAPSVQTNYKYYLAMRRHANGLGPVHQLVCDEAHALPEELMSACRIEIGKGLLKSTGRRPQSYRAWSNWAHARLSELDKPTEPDQRRRVQSLRDRLTALAQIDDTWAWDQSPDGGVVFEPTIPKLLLPYLYRAEPNASIVYMSATITPATLTQLGVDARDVTFHAAVSRFDPYRRPIYAMQAPHVQYNMSSEAKRAWVQVIDGIIDGRPDRKGIIHCKSYARQSELFAMSRHKSLMWMPRNSRELSRMLPRFRRTSGPAILISPSITTGLDFPYTDCEYVIIAKVPQVDTRGAIMRARIANTPGYRDHVVMQEIEQAAGRGMRSADDQCEVFITDGHFYRFWNQARAYAADWFSDALVFTRRMPAPPPPLERAA